MNYYEILEVSQNASQEVIRAAYKSLMQRYHPDRNPNNADIAKRALLVGKAYEVLSDPISRVAYDLELNPQSIMHVSSVQVNGKNTQQPSVNKALHGRHFLFMLGSGAFIALIILISSIESDKAEKLALERSQADFEKIQHDGDVWRADKIKKNDEAGTIPKIAENLTVQLKTTQSNSYNQGHNLSIPILGVIVGNRRQNMVLQYIANNKEFIKQNLIKDLAASDYHELKKLNGEQYLSTNIAKSINNTIGTTEGSDFQLENGDFTGVKYILMPKSFSVH